MYSLSQPAGADPITKKYIRPHQHERTVNPQPKSYRATPIVFTQITDHQSRIPKITGTNDQTVNGGVTQVTDGEG
jgi:hypothetical protein